MRCDGCPAKAVVQWIHPGHDHGPLVLCREHAYRDADRLDREGWAARELVEA